MDKILSVCGPFYVSGFPSPWAPRSPSGLRGLVSPPLLYSSSIDLGCGLTVRVNAMQMEEDKSPVGRA